MNGESRLPDQEDIQELLGVYERLCSGKGAAFLSEESFERIIDYFDETDALNKAMEAARMGVLQFPYSSALLVKKADLHLAERQYQQALDDLDMAQILDPNNIDVYILRTDAYLALDMQEMAVSLLEEAILRFDGDENRARIYDDFQPLRSSDVAETILFMINRPAHVNIQDILLMGTQQASSLYIDRSGRHG